MAFSFFKKSTKEQTKDSRYLTLTVKQVRRETSDAVSLVFDEPKGGLNYQPGQFITLILNIDGKKVRRAYSLCSSPFVGELPAVTVKKVEGGLMSGFVNASIKAGDELEVMEPMGSFVTSYNGSQRRHIVMFGGGSGITPLMSITKSVLAKEPQSVVSLVYCNRDEHSIIFRSELERLQSEYPGRLNVVHVLENASGNLKSRTGLLTVPMVTQLLDELPQWSLTETSFFTCGPAPMMDIVLEGLDKAGIGAELIKRESFTAGETSPEPVDVPGKSVGEGREVKIILNGEEHVFNVPANKSILETGLSLDIDMPYSCQSGLCTACRGKLLSGEVKMEEDDGLSASEKSEGYVLCCVGHPVSDDVVIEIG